MNGTAFLSPETASLEAEIERGLLIKEKFPNNALVMALHSAKTTNDIVAAVAKEVQNEGVIVALDQGGQLLVDFCSETPITAKALQQAREELNTEGYSLLVGRVSSNRCKLLVAQHTKRSRRQSRLLWASPSTVSFIIGLTWEKALGKLSGIFPKDDVRNAQIDAENAWIEAVIQRQEVREQCTREDGERSIDSLLEGETGYIVPWALKRNEDGSYWLDPKKKCVNRAMGTAEMEVKWTTEGPMVYLPKNFDYQRTIGQSKYWCFATDQANFEWVLVNSKPR